MSCSSLFRDRFLSVSARWFALSVIAFHVLLPVASATTPVLAAPEQLTLSAGQAPVGDGQCESADATITVHRPAPDKSNGAAIVICPGSGYVGLVNGPEGHGIAKWLTTHGITG